MQDQRLARTFVDLADSLVDHFDVVDLLTLLSERCVELLDASAAGLLLGDHAGELQLIAATSGPLETVELFQIQNDEGPCRDCYHSGTHVSSPDLDKDAERWPAFTPVAIAAGFHAMDAIPLRLRREVIGTLGLFRTMTGTLSIEERDVAQAFADVATIALLQQRAIGDAQLIAAQLQGALHSRIAIEQAKGVIAEATGVDMDRAFSLLRRYARRNHRALSDVAEDIAAGRMDAHVLTET